jgi:hypothetical protein
VAGAANYEDMIEQTWCVFNVVLYMYLYIGCTLSFSAFCSSFCGYKPSVLEWRDVTCL